MKNDMVFAKGKDGHYRYINKKELPKSSKFFNTFFITFLLLVLLGCGYFYYIDVFDAYIMSEEITIDNGGVYQVNLLPKNSKYFDYANYVYESEDESIATVDNYGQIKAVSNGTTNINVRFKNSFIKKTLKVNVDNVEVKDINPDKEIALDVNDTKKINIKINNEDNVSAKVYYESDDENVAQVDNDGNVTGVNEGEANITITTPNGVKKQTRVKVKTSNEKIQQISIKETNIVIKKNEKKKINIIITPNYASKIGITYSSSEPGIVSVDRDGYVIGLKEGSAIITAKTTEGLEANCVVSVKEDKNLVLDSYNKTLEVGEYFVINSNIKANWSSSNNLVATVDNNGRVFAKSVGTAIIKARLDNGEETTCYITVKERVIKVESITLQKDSVELSIGETYNIKAAISPSNATNKNLVYSSSDSKVASVDGNGKVVAKSIGKTNIVLRSPGTNVSTTFSVYVNKKDINPTGVYLDREYVELSVGNTLQLKATVAPSNATNKRVEWSSSDSSIVSVDSSGNIKALKKGNADIKITTSNNLYASARVIVKDSNIAVKSITLNSTSLSMFIGETKNIKATINPSDATIKTLSWSSSDNKVATVDSKGNVKALSSGKATISVKSTNNVVAKCSVVVKDIEVQKVTITSTVTKININSSKQLYASVSPDNATNKKISWKSSDTKIASIDNNGLLKALKVGSTKITATSSNGKTATITINVTDIVPTSLKLNKTSIELVEGKTDILSVTFVPSNSTYKNVTWKSSNTNVVSVDSKGNIKAIKSGSAKITVSLANNSNIKAEASITVKKKTINPTSITLNKSNLVITEDNKTGIRIYAIVTPNDATDKKVTWSSNNDNVAKVRKDGIVIPVNKGSTTIVAKTNNGLSAKCKVTVKEPTVAVTGIEITNSISSINVGDTLTLSAKITPSNASDKSVKWKSSDTSIATISSNGTIKGIKSGSVKITATSSSNSKVSAYKNIIVRKKEVKITSITLNASDITINKGSTYKLVATITPSNATNKTITWRSTNPKAADVVDGAVIAKAAGGTYIEAISADGNVKARCMVRVRDSIAVSSVALTTKSVGLVKNQTYQLQANITPSNASDKTLKWTSSNTSVATVDSNGKVTAKKQGVSTITATSLNGKTSSMNLVVLKVSPDKKYESSTLKYWIEKENTKHVITRVWVEDAYNQMRVALASNYKNGRMAPNSLITSEVSKKGYSSKGLIGTNASPPYKSGCNHSSAFTGKPVIPVLINDGKLIHNYSDKYTECYHYDNNDEAGQSSIYTHIYGLTKNGVLQHYEIKKGYESYNKQVVKDIQNDGVKNTFGFTVIVIDNKKGGKHISNNLHDARQILCQIDKNNYIFYTSSSSCFANRSKNRDVYCDGFGEIANMLAEYGCVSAFNFDGGGSSALLYKTNTTSSSKYNIGNKEDRAVSDIVYFVEK